MLIAAQRHRHLANNITNAKKTIDQSGPQKFKHLSKLTSKFSKVTDREIDLENQKLLNSIMGVMKRKN